MRQVLVTWESPQAEWSSQYNPLANLGIRVFLTSYSTSKTEM